MYGDQFGEFVRGYWGLLPAHVWHIVHRYTIPLTLATAGLPKQAA